jgi:hypothetical protein
MRNELDCREFGHIINSELCSEVAETCHKPKPKSEGKFCWAACETAEATGISGHSVSMEGIMSTVTVQVFFYTTKFTVSRWL